MAFEERERFADRKEAARLLAARLSVYKGTKPLVLAIPRGAVPMGRILADALGGELDVVLCHKIGSPSNPEFAVGAVSEDGEVTIAPYADQLGIPKTLMERGVQEQLLALRERRRLFTPYRAAMNVQGRVVIIVDDGIATGSTVLSAIQLVKRQKPKKVIVASAIAPPDVLRKLEQEADEVVILRVEMNFGAVGELYEDFSQVSDEEVIECLKTP